MATVRCKRAVYPSIPIAAGTAAGSSCAAISAGGADVGRTATLPSLLPASCNWARPVSWWGGVEQDRPSSSLAMAEAALDWQLVRGAVRQGAPVACIGLGSALAAEGVAGPRNELFDAIRADPALRFARYESGRGWERARREWGSGRDWESEVLFGASGWGVEVAEIIHRNTTRERYTQPGNDTHTAL
jgi:hypothetical protein